MVRYTVVDLSANFQRLIFAGFIITLLNQCLAFISV